MAMEQMGKMDTAGSHRKRGIKKRVAFPGSVMAMSHQLWMSGRTHCPLCSENQGPGRNVPGHLSSLPKGRWVWRGYCPARAPSSVPAPISLIDSDVVWSLKGRLADELAKDQLPSLFWLFFLKSVLQLGCQVCVDGDCRVTAALTWDELRWFSTDLSSEYAAAFLMCR